MDNREILKRDIDELKDKFALAGQGHVFDFVDQLNNEELETLLSDLKEIDPKQVNSSFKRASNQTGSQNKLEPFPDVCSYDSTQKEREQWRQIGLEYISQGKSAVLLLAGGQGTRLGTKLPKGMYQLNLPSNSSLFRVQAERLLKLQQLASKATKKQTGSVIPWYIMTSEATSIITKQYFEENKYFGLGSENVFFFEQEMIPAITPNGKIILESKCKVAMAPNGNGGLYSALLRSGALADMERRGVEFVNVYGVDNCLIKMGDPTFLGYCVHKGIDCAPKVVAKLNPEEPVGVVCLNNGKPGVIEYSEIDKELAKKINPNNGKLYYNAAHVCMNMFSVNFLRNVCDSKLEELPLHVAKKKIPAVNSAGITETPNDINGWKLELFIFDVFPFAQKMSCFEVLRNEEFSPLKNGPDAKVDCPQTCVEHISQLHINWLINAGVTVKSNGKESLCEISPLVSYEGEGLDKLKSTTISLPYHLSV